MVSRVVSDAVTGAYSVTVTDTGPYKVVRYVAPVIDGDPNWANCVLGLHMSGVNGSTSFIDETGKVVTRVGTPEISDVVGIIDGVSGYFDGSGDYLTLADSNDFKFGTGDLTFRCKARLTGLQGGYSDYAGVLIDTRKSGTGPGVMVILSNTGKLRVFGFLESASVIPLNTLVDIEVSRVSGVLRILIDGEVDASVANTTDFSDNGCVIGAPVDGQADNTYLKFKGYMKDLQLYKGVGLHTSAFTPPTTLFATTPRPGTPTGNAQVIDNVTPI